jgi:hypothetical protein
VKQKLKTVVANPLFVHGKRGQHGCEASLKKQKSLRPFREVRVQKPPMIVLEKAMVD